MTRAGHFPAFPAGILVVNLTGCLLIGIAFGLAEVRDFFSLELRYLVFVGFLGGFTTFSTFGFDTFAMVREGHFGAALTNALASVGGGVLAVWIGYRIVLAVTGGPQS